MTLDANDLEKSFINELLMHTYVNWPVEFAKIQSTDTKTVDKLVIVDDILDTACKIHSFVTPAKIQSSNEILDKMTLLDSSQGLVLDMLELNFDEMGEGTSKDFKFTKESYVKTCGDLHGKVEVFTENSKCVNDIIMNLQPLI